MRVLVSWSECCLFCGRSAVDHYGGVLLIFIVLDIQNFLCGSRGLFKKALWDFKRVGTEFVLMCTSVCFDD